MCVMLCQMPMSDSMLYINLYILNNRINYKEQQNLILYSYMYITSVVISSTIITFLCIVLWIKFVICRCHLPYITCVACMTWLHSVIDFSLPVNIIICHAIVCVSLSCMSPLSFSFTFSQCISCAPVLGRTKMAAIYEKDHRGKRHNMHCMKLTHVLGKRKVDSKSIHISCNH